MHFKRASSARNGFWKTSVMLGCEGMAKKAIEMTMKLAGFLRAVFFAFLLCVFPVAVVFADNRSDISLPTVDSPSSIYYNDRSTFVAEGYFRENFNLPDSGILDHRLGIAATMTGPRIGMRISLGSAGTGNLNRSSMMSVSNLFDIKVASSFGYGDLVFGFSWDIRGEREREIGVSGVSDSFLKYFEHTIVSHNDSNMRSIESDFALQVSYRYAGILSLCVYADRFLSLSSQSVFFSMGSILSSIGFSFSLKVPKYDALMNLRTWLAELNVSFFDLFSDKPAADMDVKLKFVLSGRMDVTFSNAIVFGNFNDVVSSSLHVISFVFRSGNMYPRFSIRVPFAAYAGISGQRRIGIEIGFKYVM